jgi:signal transduction histidine kinase
MSVISVHGNVAAEAIGRDDLAAAGAVERIRAASAATMRELRATVKLLRAGTPDPSDRGAVVGLAGLPHLAQVAEDAGVIVELDLDTSPDGVDGAVGAAAYRIVQESLTNVLRHAGATRARVSVHVCDGRLVVEVADDGRGTGAVAARVGHPDAPAGTGGQGIAGMAERAALLGGSLTAAAGEHEGFVVRADLPVRLP